VKTTILQGDTRVENILRHWFKAAVFFSLVVCGLRPRLPEVRLRDALGKWLQEG
jgi:hypothetical protein